MITRKFQFNSFTVVLTLLAGLVTLVANAQDKPAADKPATEKPKYTISEIMKALHKDKGGDSIGKKVQNGQGTKEDFAKLVEFYASLPLNEPPEGSAASWKEKSTSLLDAAKALNDGKEGAVAQYKKAVNCKACHDVHRGQ